MITIVLAVASLAVALAVVAAHVAPGPGLANLFDNSHWTVSYSAAALMAWLGYFRPPDSSHDALAAAADKAAQFWFAAGFTTFAIGQLLWDLQVYTGWNPFPGPSDAFYLLLGPCCALGFCAALGARVKPGERLSVGLDVTALSIAILAITLSLYLPRRGDIDLLQLGVLVAYPVGLLSATCCAVILVLAVRPRPAPGWITMLAYTAFSGGIWMAWNSLTLDNALSSGTLLNASFSVSTLAGGYAAAHWRLDPQRGRLYERVAGNVRYTLPMALVLLACAAIVIVNVVSGIEANIRTLINGSGLFVVIIAILRQSYMLRERDTLQLAESVARQRERRMREFFLSSEDPIFVCRVEPGRFVYEELNPAARTLLGRPPAEAGEFTPREAFPAAVADKVCGFYEQCVRTGEPMRYELDFHGSTGRHWLDTRLSPIRDAGGRVTHLHGIIRTLTEHRRQTEKLEKLAADLDQARHDAEAASRTKSLFLAKMSHELRTPLNAILGFTELMLQRVFGGVGSQRYEEYLGDIHNSGRMLLSLVNDVLDLSKLESGHYQLHDEPVDLGELAGETCAMMEPRAQAKAIRLLNLRRPMPRVRADRRAIGQILLNLVTNAIKFTPAGGVVEVTTDQAADGSSRLIVRDTGQGIPANEIASVREAFVQGRGATNGAEPGTGLGLAIVCSLAELHGGSVAIDSEVGRGTTVTIRLPAARLLPH